jgi:hypothetical protein
MIYSSRSGYCSLHQYHPDLSDIWTHHLLPFLLPSGSECVARKAVMLFHIITINRHPLGWKWMERVHYEMKIVWIRPDVVRVSFMLPTKLGHTTIMLLHLSQCVFHPTRGTSFLCQYHPSYHGNPTIHWKRESIEVFHRERVFRYVLEDDDFTWTQVEHPVLPDTIQYCIHRMRMLYSVMYERPEMPMLE